MEFSADVLAVGSPPGVEILSPDSGGRVCAGEFGEFCAQVCTTDDDVAGNAADIGYTRDSSLRHAQVNKVMETRDEAWQAPPHRRAMPTLPGLPDPGGTLKLEHSPEPGGTPGRGDELEPGGAPELRDVQEPGGKLELGDASEVGGTDGFVSAPTTPLLVLEERVPDRHRAVSSDREREARDSDEIREGVMRLETMAPNQEMASGLTSLVEPDGGSHALHALLAEKAAGRERAKRQDRLLQEKEQTPAADSTTFSSGHSGAWAEMASTFGELEADDISFEKSRFAAEGCVDRPDVLSSVSSTNRLRVFSLRETRRKAGQWGSIR